MISRMRTDWGHGLGGIVALALFVAAIGVGGARAASQDDTWRDLRGDLFGDRPIGDGGEWIAIEAPYRAHDAAIVPIDITALRPQRPDSFIKTITLVIDENPAPVAAVFHLGPQSGLASISTRVRVNAYSHVRAIAETNTGELFMATRFVKASGGCSAPASKDAEDALANLGKMRLRQFAPIPAAQGQAGSPAVREAKLMIRHPNHSGFQMDQITRYYIAAHFVHDIQIRRGDDLILSVEGAISLSEDPTLRFKFLAEDDDVLHVRVEDTENQVFTQGWNVTAASAPDS